MKKTSSKDIIDRIKSKHSDDKKNYTFRLSQVLMDDFNEKCRKNKVKATRVIEELIGDFNKS